jgi:hypothetical protein
MHLFKSMASAGECVSLGINKALDLEDKLYIAPPVEALAGSALIGVELGKLALPKAQDIGFEVNNTRHIANLEVEAVWDRWSAIESAGLCELGSHGEY